MTPRKRLREAAFDWLRAAAPRYGSEEYELDALERAALEYAGNELRHRAWCDAWLAIGLAAYVVSLRDFRPYSEYDNKARAGLAQRVGIAATEVER